MFFTPAVRISFGLVALTICLLLIGQLLGFAPDRTAGVIESRKVISEFLAVQLSAAVERGDYRLIRETLRSVVARDNNITSAAMRTVEGDLIAEAGEHLAHWQPPPDGRSTPTQVLIPILKGQNRFATIEVSFSSLWANNILTGFKNSYFSLILFVTFTGFTGYFLLIKRTLRELDPSAVIPARVQAAFDVLEEGILVIDEKEQIVLANTSFAKIAGKSTSDLIGVKGSELAWQGYKSQQQRKLLPWIQVQDGKKNLLRVRLTMVKRDCADIILAVNAAPILDGRGKSRGVLVSFDDISELEETNRELSQAVDKLQITSEEVLTKKKELEFLAAHDPLTLLLNRRALHREFDTLFKKAHSHDLELSCIMCDIDHFKAVNDTHGHATGDEVIKMVARTLQKNSREADLVGRYGGEEFCLTLPGLTLRQAFDMSDRMRQAIEEDSSSGIKITMSFGVSSLKANAPSPNELINQADKALYIAKKSGRNKVVCWADEEKTADTQKGSPIQDSSQQNTTENDNKIDHITVRLQEAEALAEKRDQKLKHYAVHDVLTGLPNRTLFYDRIDQALKRGQRFDCIVAVLLMSVDAIKRVNETLGFAAGDVLTKEVSKRLTEILRDVDSVAKLPSSPLEPTISRLGQEDFGILLTDLTDVNVIVWIVRRIFNTLAQPFNIDGNEIHTTLNIGISTYPFDGKNPGMMEKNAAAARSYAQNQLGSNKYYFYSYDIHDTSIEHLHIESKLHNAIKKDEFLLHYQPKIDTKTGIIKGTEALIRWEDPVDGLISPQKFIPVAEYSGLIDKIGEWVLTNACEQVRTWLDMGIKNCSVAVNFSARQFHQRDLASTISKIMAQNKLDPSYLVVEVTESTIMDNINNSIRILKEIRKLGVGIALDDFGTGYSSFANLKDFPLTHVKIDRSFVTNMETNKQEATLVEAIINMAHGMGLKVTAEGVENEEQADLLYRFNCDEMQGFLFSRPIPKHETTELLRNGINYKISQWT